MMKTSKSILLVEDDKIDALTVRRALRDLKVTNRLDHETNGLEAINFLEGHRNNLPCIILLDLNMPKMNGLEFLEEIKKDEQFRKIPVVILTTSGAEPDISRSFSIGVVGYMVKPVDYKQFIEIIREIKLYWTLSEIPDL